MKHLKTTQRGFTIVELLIVVVVIAILAAITIVAYNGIQVRANNSAAESSVNTMVKKLTAYNSLSGTWPTATGTVMSSLNGYSESSLSGSNIAIGTPTAANGRTTLRVQICDAGAGIRIYEWDYAAATPAITATPTSLGTTTGTCTNATA